MQAGARLGVAIPEGLQNAAWTCVAHAGSRCSAATASGNLNQSLDGLAAGSALEFHLDARVAARRLRSSTCRRAPACRREHAAPMVRLRRVARALSNT